MVAWASSGIRRKLLQLQQFFADRDWGNEAWSDRQLPGRIGQSPCLRGSDHHACRDLKAQLPHLRWSRSSIAEASTPAAARVPSAQRIPPSQQCEQLTTDPGTTSLISWTDMIQDNTTVEPARSLQRLGPKPPSLTGKTWPAALSSGPDDRRQDENLDM